MSATMALVAVWKSGQPNALSIPTSRATCHTSRTKANPTYQSVPTVSARIVILRRPNRSVSWPPHICKGMTNAGTMPKTTPTTVILIPSSWFRKMASYGKPSDEAAVKTKMHRTRSQNWPG